MLSHFIDMCLMIIIIYPHIINNRKNRIGIISLNLVKNN